MTFFSSLTVWLSLIALAYTLSMRIQNTDHLTNIECCQSKKGTICGTFIKDCCMEGCQQNWILGAVNCKDKKVLDDKCIQNCKDICVAQNKIMCGANIISAAKCCSQQDCIEGSCKSGTEYKLQNCQFDDEVTPIIGSILK